MWARWACQRGASAPGQVASGTASATLSDHDAARWLDAQEKVDQIPAPAPVVARLHGFVTEPHHRQPKRRKGPESFQPLTARFGQPVRISTDKR